MRLRVILTPSDEGGYTALVPSLPGCISEGDTREQAVRNIQEAIELYLEPIDDDLNVTDKAEILELALGVGGRSHYFNLAKKTQRDSRQDEIRFPVR